MPTPQQQVVDKCKEVFALAKEKYGVDLSECGIRFDLKGRVAGQACGRGFRENRKYHMRFNLDMCQRDINEILDEIIQHETAHIICFMKPELGSNHDYGWASVCRGLGGNGSRTHEIEVVYGKGNTYEYVSTKGHKIRLSAARHKHVQQGRSFEFRGGKGIIHRNCAYNIVGCNGRTLATPIPKGGANVATNPIAVMVEANTPVVEPAPRMSLTTQAIPGESKADTARRIMLQGHQMGQSYDQIIAAIMLANGHSRALASSYYKNNAAKVGVPAHD